MQNQTLQRKLELQPASSAPIGSATNGKSTASRRGRRRIDAAGWPCAALAMLAVIGVPQPTVAQSLPTQIQRTIEQQLAPAYFEGDVLSVLGISSKLAANVDAKIRSQIDRGLIQRGLPDLATILLDSRMELREHWPEADVPAVSPQELEVIQPALRAEINRTLSAADTALETQSGSLRTVTFDDFEARLWKLHVLQNELANTIALIQYGQSFQRLPVRTRTTAEATHEGSGNVAAPPTLPFDELMLQAELARQKIEEFEVLVRIDRLAVAVSQFQKTADSSVADRIKAAWAADMDGYAIVQYFQENQGPNDDANPQLRSLAYRSQVEQQITRLHELVGPDLRTKSRHLFTGLHWWLRGRYGAGPAGFGMLKHPSALTSPQAMFSLYMPSTLPTPTAPGEMPSVPEVDRRHHYGWMFEYQRLFRTFSTGSISTNSGPKNRETSRTKLSRFY